MNSLILFFKSGKEFNFLKKKKFAKIDYFHPPNTHTHQKPKTEWNKLKNKIEMVTVLPPKRLFFHATKILISRMVQGRKLTGLLSCDYIPKP